ncbi:AAA family ATPase [Weeksellaceae bacterium A-14]
MKNFKRHIFNELVQWKASSNAKPLILRGARQVGKTTLVRSFGESYTHFIELNLEKPEDANLVERSNSVQELVNFLALKNEISPKEFPETLLFIDEIQESEKAISFLRYFYEDLPELNVIAAGSLLEHTLKKTKNYPVGRINYLYLFPLNFQEYLEAQGKKNLLERFRSVPVDDIAHELLMKEFHTYCIIGGMPEIVANYVANHDLSALPQTYESIWNTYKDDVIKYADSKSEENVMKHIVNTAASFVDQRIKFQNFGHSNYKSREVSEAFNNLDAAKVIQVIYPCTNVEPPILPDYKKSPRLQFLDTGILNFDLNIQADLLLMKDLSEAYKGAIIPHIINQEVLSLNTTDYKKTNFWVRDKTQSSAEVDLVIAHGKFLIPVEIKSGKTGSLKSLHQFVNQAPHPFAVRMYGGKFSIEETVTPEGKPYLLMNLPYYLGTYLKQYINYFITNYNVE